MRLLLATFSVFSVFIVCACASPQPYMLPQNDEESTAEGGAWAGAGMYFRKAMPDRREVKPWQFYYKHCDTTGEEVYFSKTSYDCNGPTY